MKINEKYKNLYMKNKKLNEEIDRIYYILYQNGYFENECLTDYDDPIYYIYYKNYIMVLIQNDEPYRDNEYYKTYIPTELLYKSEKFIKNYIKNALES